LLLCQNRLQHIARFGDVGKIDLGLQAISIGTGSASRLRVLAITRTLEMRADLLRLMVFKRTGMRLFFGDAHLCQHVENRFAFDFQFSSQVVNSNLTHPPLCPSGLVPLSLHINLTV
jgi:hypothetical protein